MHPLWLTTGLLFFLFIRNAAPLAALLRFALRSFLQDTLATRHQQHAGPALRVEQGIAFNDQLILRLLGDALLDFAPSAWWR